MNPQFIQKVEGAYPNQSLNAFLSASTDKQLSVQSIVAQNGVNAPNAIGIAHSTTSEHWKLFGLRVADVDLTADVQAGTAVSIFTTTNGEGCLVQATRRFGLICFNISQAQTGSPVYTYQYWNGSTWATLSLKNSPQFSVVGESNIIFYPPLDWAVGDGTEGGSDDLYSIRLLASTAPSQAVKVTEVKVCELIAYRENINPYGQLQVDFSGRKPLLLQQGESVIGFFALPSASNTMEASYQINP